MLKYGFLLIFLLFSLFNSSAQTISRCGTEEYVQFLLSQNPGLQEIMEQVERDLQEFLQSTAFQSNKNVAQGIYKIPVVVHLIGDYVIDRVFDAKVQQQIDILNQDYRKIVGSLGDGSGVDTKIEFCLATVDPLGNTATGIVKIHDLSGSPFPSPWVTNAPLPSDANSDNSLKSISHWSENEYLNIYVVKNIITIRPPDPPLEVLGYGYPPGILQTNPEWDGVVIDMDYFGITTDTKYNRGRTLTHEVGHWLDLIHPWGKSVCPDCSGTDKVDDTPPCCGQNYSAYPTCSHPSQCSNTRQIENYMDYSDDQCMNIFTQGQADRMQATLNVTRSSLFSSDAACSFSSHCNNGALDADEEQIDCGGADCLPCILTGGGVYVTNECGIKPQPNRCYICCVPNKKIKEIYGCLKGDRKVYAREEIKMGGFSFDYQGGHVLLNSKKITIYAPFSVTASSSNTITMRTCRFVDPVDEGWSGGCGDIWSWGSDCHCDNESRSCPLIHSGKMESSNSLDSLKGVSDKPNNLARENSLNISNPFPDHIHFEFSLKEKSNINLTLQNLLGQTIATPISSEVKEQGEHTLSFDASALPAGIYFCTFEAKSEKGEVFKEVKKLVKMK